MEPLLFASTLLRSPFPSLFTKFYWIWLNLILWVLIVYESSSIISFLYLWKCWFRIICWLHFCYLSNCCVSIVGEFDWVVAPLSWVLFASSFDGMCFLNSQIVNFVCWFPGWCKLEFHHDTLIENYSIWKWRCFWAFLWILYLAHREDTVS